MVKEPRIIGYISSGGMALPIWSDVTEQADPVTGPVLVYERKAPGALPAQTWPLRDEAA